ncbi:MAG: peptidoglycan bridge formation glycyltransferase FemA/FemB family protein [Candidatus Moranbacteria bacterium]|nr:peptidoglycan bridge formation glycyltransferase FemA/FemB family protein [Candidatus Moranbacteria bacterium]
MDNFLQSKEWAHFQEMSGHDLVQPTGGAYGFIHTLPIVGSYLYTPRFPSRGTVDPESLLGELIAHTKKARCAWVRIEPETEEILKSWERAISEWGGNDGIRLIRAPHDMQPREIFVVEISKSESDLLAEMKSKTRYNIRLAEKKGVRIFATREKRYREIFFKLIEATAKRQDILPHPESYYENMLTVFPEERLSLFVAEYKGGILAANLVLFSGDTATYLHGGTSDTHREVMAPMLLQWEQMREAKRRGCCFYDFGGIHTFASGKDRSSGTDTWAGITRFKCGFSPNTVPTVFPGCYDMVINWRRYGVYRYLRFLQQPLSIMKKFLRR